MPSLPTSHLSRRSALGLGASSLLVPTIGRSADASDMRFVFVHCIGGWDPFMVFAPMFDDSRIELEAAAAPAQVGDLAFVNHPDRPAVTGFFTSLEFEDFEQEQIGGEVVLGHALSEDARKRGFARYSYARRKLVDDSKLTAASLIFREYVSLESSTSLRRA